MSAYPQLRPFRQGDFEKLVRLAEVEKHGVLAPTHVIRRDEEILGYFSVNGLPWVVAWLAKGLSPRESFGLINAVENQQAMLGAPGIVFPIPKDTPFHPLFEDLGFKNVGSYDLFIKEYK